MVDGSRDVAAVQTLLAEVPLAGDFGALTSLVRRRRKLPAAGGTATRIAILGGATTDFLGAPLALELESRGVVADIRPSDYNTYAHQMLDPESETVAWGPDLAVLLLTPFNIADWPAVGDDAETVDGMAEAAARHWIGLCAALNRSAGCEVVITNFHALPTRPNGNLAARLPWDRNAFIRRVNDKLAQAAPRFLHILDVEALAAHHGVAHWFDARYWHHAKQPVSFGCMVPFVRALAAQVAAIFGQTAKCLVLDLDNTLWGGVIGDDGVDGIKVGLGTAEGEAFRAFQSHVRALKDRGIVLAVASKNEPENAREPFEKHPEMVLKLEDFVSFKATWEPKPASLEAIARELNIGLDALVFVDDNPAERALVRQTLPQVKVVELTDDPADYPRLLDATGWFDIARLTAEDRAKSDQYRQKAALEQAASAATDYGTYLWSLNQRAIVGAFEDRHLDRIAQLINKTNQFNLTTRRHTRAEVEALMADPDAVTLYVRLADSFGDNGLISVAIGRVEGDRLDIDTWLMSCRVFKRGVEDLVANALFDAARERGLARVSGAYLPTAKNKLVADLYPGLGFARAGQVGEDGTMWQMAVQDYAPKEVQIELVEDFE